MTTLTTKISPKNPKFYCEKCQFETDNKKDFSKHNLTAKHKKLANNNDLTTKKPIILPKMYFCANCSKEYKDRAGLWRHKKKCTIIDTSSSNIILELVKQNHEFKELIYEQNKQNLELQKQVIELASKTNSGNIINSNNTTNNNKFNLNFFLNEQCKDALNIMDFVNSLTIQLTDLENIGRLGYTEGISKIFINGLKQLDIFKRPIHCSDLKRETLYVKDENIWEKDSEEKGKIKQAIKSIANKNIKQIPDWQKENPSSQDTSTKKHDEYMKIVGESMGGFNAEEDERNYNKIIKNVAKEVTIDK